MPLRQHIATLADGQAYRHAVFYKLPGGLRFRMAEGGGHFAGVLTAVRKATVVCEDVFAGADTILVHLQRYATANRFDLRPTLKQLRLAGITLPRVREIWTEPVPRSDPDDDDSWWLNALFELPRSHLASLLWCAFAKDMWELQPNPHCQVYLINPATGLMAHPYDDRGMDVVGTSHEALRQLYTAHHAWLLDYDRETMDRSFATPPPA
ncbi:DUF3885 domain-containing protein [Massilia violaceinigra]|uniref:DUF3885 domain-containing protein n=1 Tax=Massilia violaceinigra TaxID=2045208 RepID=A0ABY4A382_9BURK|nr:DUF3885 domain-containing protein [Massilia violaceinigra]UOD29226.1 DUF3885 domain-containing protein [Massilia violaceinigra]